MLPYISPFDLHPAAMDALRSLPGHSLEHREIIPTTTMGAATSSPTPPTRGVRLSSGTISKESLTASPLLLHLLQVVSQNRVEMRNMYVD